MGLLDTLLGHASEKSLDHLAEDFAPLLAPGETLQRAFGLIRDLIVFTDRRMLLVNKQGVTGSKVEYLSVPYRSIVMFSIETAGHFDLEAELRVWVSGQPSPIVRSLGRDSGAPAILALLAQHAPR
ncbi:MAG TPA: PH domain-containing protein [Lysobacter sp.]